MDGPHVRLDGNGLCGNMLAFQKEHIASGQRTSAHERETVERDVFQVVGHEVQEARVGSERTRVHAAFRHEASMKCGARVLVLLVGKQPLDQDIARLARGELRDIVVDFGRILRDEALRLNLEQRRGHEQKIARHVEVEVLHARDLSEVLVGDLGDRDGANIDFLPAHQVQQKIERALEACSADFVGHSFAPPRKP